MKEIVLRYAERIDALAVRERILIFFAVALGLILIANAAFIGPLRAKYRNLGEDVAQQQKDMATTQADIERLARQSATDPDAANRSRLTALREELRALNLRIVEQQRHFTAPESMARVLEELLEKNRGLTLVDMQTLPIVPIAPARQGAAAGIYRHGIEITVRGTYGELYEYLRALESLPNHLYWARAELTAAAHPTLTLKLTVHTLSFDRAWLVV